MAQCEQKGKIKHALRQLHFSSKFIFMPPVWGHGLRRFAEWSLPPKGLDRTETASKQTPCLGAAAGNYHTPFSFAWLTRWPDSRLLAGETREDDSKRRGRAKRPATSAWRRLARGYGGEKPGKDARDALNGCQELPRPPARLFCYKSHRGDALPALPGTKGSTSAGQSTWQIRASPASFLLHGLLTHSKMALLTSSCGPPSALIL